MELTKEYFDERFAEQRQYMDGRFANIESKMATKKDLVVLRQQAESYADEIGQSVIKMISFLSDKMDQCFESVGQRLDKLESMLKSIQPNQYLVKEGPRELLFRPGELQQMFIEIMAKKGHKIAPWQEEPPLDTEP